jgi:hypothetical protein
MLETVKAKYMWGMLWRMRTHLSLISSTVSRAKPLKSIKYRKNRFWKGNQIIRSVAWFIWKQSLTWSVETLKGKFRYGTIIPSRDQLNCSKLQLSSSKVSQNPLKKKFSKILKSDLWPSFNKTNKLNHYKLIFKSWETKNNLTNQTDSTCIKKLK